MNKYTDGTFAQIGLLFNIISNLKKLYREHSAIFLCKQSAKIAQSSTQHGYLTLLKPTQNVKM